jgi:RNA polymerase sigma factor (sigma-70 family)
MARDGHHARRRWLRAVLDRYERPLIRYATRLTGDADRARDVVQDVFIRLCAAERELIADHLAEWLFTVCRNRALDLRRKETRMRRLDDAAVETRESGEPAPAAVLEDTETAGRLVRLLATLPDNQQEVLVLKFQGGLSYKEIAAVTGQSVGNVGFLIHTGLMTLRELLRAEGS